MPIGGLAVIGLVGAGVASVLLWDRNAASFGVVTADNFSLFVNLVLVVVGLLTVVFSSQTLERDGLPVGEYYSLVLFAIVGMMLMAQATDLLLVFLALETMSIAVYVLTGLRRDQPNASEAAFKYFLLGAFASSFFLYGIAFVYGVTGTTHLERAGAAIAAQSMSGNPMLLLAIGLLIVGFAFKVAAVPFHMWSPDAYEGAPAVVTGFMSTGVKAAAVAAFARLFLSTLEPDGVGLDADPVGDRRRHHGGGHGGRRLADQPQADAGLLEHRARRLPAGGDHRRQRRRQGVAAVLPGGLRRHQRRRLRHHRAARLAPPRQRRAARLRRAWRTRIPRWPR